MRHIRRFLFITLGLDGYLTVISKSYFMIFKAGFLKNNPVYDWHYFVRNLIREGDVIIDMGANMGYYSAMFSALTGSSGKVYSIEPVPALVKQLKRQVKRKKNVAILPFALGNENKEQVFLSIPEGIYKAGYPQHGLFSVQDHKGLKDEKFVFGAIQRKGSELFAGIRHIDYIKCDVEGYEKIILEDMESLLIGHQPIVQVEIRNEHFTKLIGFFSQMGYKAFKLDHQHLIAVENLPLYQQRCFDTLFVSPRYFNRILPFVISMDTKKHLSQPVKHPYL